MDRGGGWAIVHGVARVRYDLATKPPPQVKFMFLTYFYFMINHDKNILPYVFDYFLWIIVFYVNYLFMSLTPFLLR